MSTITEAQNELEDVLVNQIGDHIPDDMSDWNMEDWTIFALNYLKSNIEDALEGLSTAGDLDIPKWFEKDSPLWQTIFNALKITGDFTDALEYMAEGLTQEQYEELDSFFGWLMTEDYSLGHGNYYDYYLAFKQQEGEN